METLANEYDSAADAFYRNNEALVANRDAQSRVTDALSKVGDAVSRVKGELLEKFTPAIEVAAEKLAEFINNIDVDQVIQTVVNAVKEAVVWFEKWGPVITAVVVALTAMSVISSVISLVSGLVTAFAALSNPVTATILVISLLAAAIVAFWDEISGFFSALGEQISGDMEELSQLFSDGWDSICDAFDAAVELISQGFQEIGEFFTALGEQISGDMAELAQLFSDGWTAIGDIFVSAVDWLYECVLRIAEFFVVDIPNACQSAWTGFLSFLTQLATLPGLVGGYLLEALQSVIEWASNLAAKGLESGQQFVEEIISGISSLVGEIYSEGANLIDKFISGVESAVSGLYQIGQNAVNQIKSGINSAWSGLTSWFNSLWNSLFSNRTVSVNVNASSSGAASSNAIGLDYVPYNRYIAELHRGEMVLTSSEAENYRKGRTANSAGITIIQNIQSVPQTPVELAATTQSYFEQARWAF